MADKKPLPDKADAAKEKGKADAKDKAKEPEAPVKSAKPPNKWLVVGGIIAGIIVIEAIVLVIVFGRIFPAPEKHADAKPKSEVEKVATIEDSIEVNEAGEKVPAVERTLVIEDVVVNPAGSAGKRFLSISLALELTTIEAMDELKARQSELRDELITILSTRTFDELADVQNREPLRREIHRKAAGLLDKGAVIRTSFTNFILQ